MLLRRVERLRGVAGIKVLRQSHALVLDGERRGVRVGDQHQALAAGAQFSQKHFRARQESHAGQRLALQGGDVELKLSRPIVDAIPLQGVRDILEFERQALVRLCLADAIRRGVSVGDQGPPKPIIEAQVQQCAVHVEQHGIDTFPVHGGGSIHCAYDTSMRDLAALAESLMPIVERASDAIMRIYDGAFAVQSKDDSSPLTLADLESQRVIIDGLKSITPDIPVLSEESAAAPWAERRTWRELWVVDPLDGTREFVKRNGEFTVNIALVVEHEPVLGVVSAPAQGTTFWGIAGVGAFTRGREGAARRIHTAPPHQPLRVVGSRSHASSQTAAYLARLAPHVMC